MYAGFARRCITPPIGTHMMGYGNRTDGCVGVYDDLFVSVIAVAEAEHSPPVVIAAFDVSAFGRRHADALHSACAALLPPERLLLTTSHTHAGPVVADRPTLPAEDAYFETLVAATVNAVAAAMEDVCPARLSAGEAPVALGGNRRIVEDGKVRMGHNPDGQALPTMTVWTLERQGTTDIMLFNTAIHPVTMGPDNLYISAEWPGAARRDVQRSLPGTEAVFLQGCAGDQNCWRDHKTYAQVVDNGRLASDAVLAAYHNRQPLASTPVSCISRTCMLPLDDGKTWPVPLFGMRLGGAIMTTICGEPMVEYALFQRAKSPAQSMMALGYSQGSEGYIGTATTYAEGGYEAIANFHFPVSQPFAPACETILKDALLQLAQDLFA